MKAVVLFSGGLDSTVILAKAIAEGKQCLALAFDYGQRHRVELEAAAKIANHYQIPLRVISITPQVFGNSALVSDEKISQNRSPEEIASEGVPTTYVPARNTLFLAYALGHAEMMGAEEIHFGCNQMDLNAYPDCSPEFISAFQGVMNVATKQAVEGNPPKLVCPLIDMEKTEIVNLGKQLNVPIEMTHSCYDPTPAGTACGVCDACILREKAMNYS